MSSADDWLAEGALFAVKLKWYNAYSDPLNRTYGSSWNALNIANKFTNEKKSVFSSVEAYIFVYDKYLLYFFALCGQNIERCTTNKHQ